jgi:hypothetical protein
MSKQKKKGRRKAVKVVVSPKKAPRAIPKKAVTTTELRVLSAIGSGSRTQAAVAKVVRVRGEPIEGVLAGLRKDGSVRDNPKGLMLLTRRGAGRLRNYAG